MASIGAELLSNPANPLGYTGLGPMAASALEVFAHAAAPRGRPAWNIDTIEVGEAREPVEQATVLSRPFGDLKRFRHDGLPENAPRLLIVAPMSGHYATLLRGTVSRMLESCEVYVTDWADARMVPLSEGPFDLDDYIDYLIEFLSHIRSATGQRAPAVRRPGLRAHVVGLLAAHLAKTRGHRKNFGGLIGVHVHAHLLAGAGDHQAGYR